MSDEQSQLPTDDNRDAWRAYWAAQGMPWRTEPEIDEERQQFLTERRAIKPESVRGVYPFKDIKLTRADVEWLLATHESGGLRGPVVWSDVQQREREGLDLRGADLRRQNLGLLPLARLVGGVTEQEWYSLATEQHRWAAIHLEDANLRGATLEGARLVGAHMEDASAVDASFCQANMGKIRAEGASLAGANLTAASVRGAHFERASLVRVQFPGADLRRTFFDVGTNLNGVRLVGEQGVGPRLADVRWNGVNLAMTNWSSVKLLGDEYLPRRGTPEQDLFDNDEQSSVYNEAVRANRQLATALRDQGLNEPADQFAYRAQVLQRRVFRQQRLWGRAFGSWLLDVVAGYDYKPMRSFLTYLVVVLGFAAAYFALGTVSGKPLTWNEAIVVSMTAFHGRGFFSAAFQPGDLQAAVAAAEAFIGLLIEIVLIATFTQRFFAR